MPSHSPSQPLLHHTLLTLLCTLLTTPHFVVPQPQIPLFLGLSLPLSNLTLTTLSSTAVSLAHAFNPADAGIRDDLRAVQAMDGWVLPPLAHVTSLYVGGRVPAGAPQSVYYKYFREGVPIRVQFGAVAYIPGGILAYIAFFDRDTIYNDNSFPHCTLLSKSLSPVYSNNLIAALYSTSPIFKQLYDNEFTTPSASPVGSADVQIDGNTMRAYWIILPLMEIVGYTKKFYQ